MAHVVAGGEGIANDKDHPLYVGSAADAPQLIASIPYSSLPANIATNFFFDGVLARRALSRTVSTYNTMDQAPATYQARMYDSSIATNHRTSGGGTATTTLTNPANNSGIVCDTSENTANSNLANLAAHVDSIQFIVTMGATAPTTGSLNIYMGELK